MAGTGLLTGIHTLALFILTSSSGCLTGSILLLLLQLGQTPFSDLCAGAHIQLLKPGE